MMRRRVRIDRLTATIRSLDPEPPGPLRAILQLPADGSAAFRRPVRNLRIYLENRRANLVASGVDEATAMDRAVAAFEGGEPDDCCGPLEVLTDDY